MNSEDPIPTIPKDRPLSWEDWLKGRRDRRQTGNRVAPGVVRRPSSSSDKRLRRLFGGQRGMPFKQVDEL